MPMQYTRKFARRDRVVSRAIKHVSRFALEPLEARLQFTALPSGFSETLVASGLNGATAMDVLPDGRVLVTLQAGDVRVVKNGTLLATPFAHVNADTAVERGLGGIAHDPNFATNGFVYLYYTVPANGSTPAFNMLSRFTASGDVALAGSKVDILNLGPLGASPTHNGGAMHFGTDNKLYLDVGENAEPANSQTLANLKGKLLRLDVSTFGPGDPVNATKLAPADNPFYSTATGINRAIYALGLRNPFTLGVQPGTNTIFINDVGASGWEEVNRLVPAANYGWNAVEGFANGTPAGLGPGTYRDPEMAYPHTGGPAGGGTAVIGGAFYNPPAGASNPFPSSYLGKYFYADLGANWMRVFDPAVKGTFANPDTSSPFATGLVNNPVRVALAPDGGLYYLSRGLGGELLKISYNNSSTAKPTITNQPVSKTVSVGQAATFSVTASGTGTLTYQWQRNNGAGGAFANIAGATAASYTFSNAQVSDNGAQFRVIVSNANGGTTSNAATLTVSSGQAPLPSINITGGLRGGKFDAGRTITFSLAATDPEDGAVPASRFTYQIDYVSSLASTPGGIVRPFVTATSGQATGSFTPATVGPYTKSDVLYRISFTATDSSGRSTTTTRDVAPNTVTLTLQTSPPGLPVTIDGQSFAAPTSFSSVVGFSRDLNAASFPTVNGVPYHFLSWSDGGAASHSVFTPATNTTYTAAYDRAGLNAEFFDFNAPLTTLPDLGTRKSDVTRVDAQLNYPSVTTPWAGLGSGYADTFVARHQGYVKIGAAGSYTFSLNSDDGSKLWVDGALLIDNNGLHNMTEKSATLALSAGYHHLRTEYFENDIGAGLQLSYAGPGIAKQTIPSAALYTLRLPLSQTAGGDNLVSVEAENFDASITRNGKNWIASKATGFSGTGSLTTANPGALIDTGFATTSPQLNYRVNFTRAGTYHVWVRGLGPAATDDSLHVGLDGAAVSTSDRVGGFTTSFGWSRSTMDGPTATIVVATPGLHTLNVWMREDGTVFDKLLLTTNASYTPTGNGPSENPRVNG
jgi:glucose/arabinose dehydrogenase